MNDVVDTIETTIGEEITRAPTVVRIKPPNFNRLPVSIVGASQLVVCAFSEKAREDLAAIVTRGPSARSTTKTRTPRDFKADYEGARHIAVEGWDGIVFTSLRNAMITAAGTSAYTAAKVKSSIFILPQGVDRVDGVPLVRIHGKPQAFNMPGRLPKTGAFHIITRPRWLKWGIEFEIEFDADWFKPVDVLNLLDRAGKTVGIGEGRYGSKTSNGLGWGCFRIVPKLPKL